MGVGTEWKSPESEIYSVRQSSLHPVRYGIWGVRSGTGRWALAKPAHMSSKNKMQAVLDRSCRDCCKELRHTGAMVVAFATKVKSTTKR